MIAEVGKLLQFPSPPVVSSHPSYRRDSGQSTPNVPTFPVDKMCADIIYKALCQVQEKQHLPDTNSRFASAFNTNKDDTDKFFSTPTLCSEAKDLLRREHPNLKKKFFDPSTSALDNKLSAMDRHFRLGAKVSSFTLLLSDALARSYEDPYLVGESTLQEMLKVLNDCLGFCLQEFSLGFAMTSLLRRSLVLDKLFLPSVGSKDRMLNLPLGGNDLFDNKFSEATLKEAKHLKAEDTFDLRRRLNKRRSSFSAGQLGTERPRTSAPEQNSPRQPRTTTTGSSSNASS